MKKIIILLLLIACIIASLSFGTLSIFTKTTEPVDGVVSASKFIINTSTQTKNPNAFISPGEDGFWDFSVTNFIGDTVNEVDMDMRIRVDLGNVVGSNPIDGLKVGLFSGNRLIGKYIIKRGYIVMDFGKAFSANIQNTYDFKIKFLWEEGLAGDLADMENQVNVNQSRISVSVTGTQCLDNNCEYEETIVDYYSEIIPGIKVTSITVTAEGGVTTLEKHKTTLQMYATVSPEDATNKTVIWSLDDTNKATIDCHTGLLTKKTNNKTDITVIATAADGSGIKGTYIIYTE